MIRSLFSYKTVSQSNVHIEASSPKECMVIVRQVKRSKANHGCKNLIES